MPSDTPYQEGGYCSGCGRENPWVVDSYTTEISRWGLPSSGGRGNRLSLPGGCQEGSFAVIIVV